MEAREERAEAKTWVRESGEALEVIKDFVMLPVDVQNKALLFDAKTEKEDRLSKNKMTEFLSAKARMMEPAMAAIRGLLYNFNRSLVLFLDEEELAQKEKKRKEELRKGKRVEERDTKMEDSQLIQEDDRFSFTDKPDKDPTKGPNKDSIVIITNPQGVASFIPKDSHLKDPSTPLGTLSSKKEKPEEPTSPIVTLVTNYGTLPLLRTPQSPAKGREPLVAPPSPKRRVSCG